MKFENFNFKKVSSTNNVAINLIKNRKKETGYVYADKQTKGKGTYGKKWISTKGNLFISIFFNLKKNYPSFHEFSIINPVIISDVIKNFCKKKNISIKWPNDIFVKKKKICGILQELITHKNKKFLIIGIGINLVSNPIIKNKYQATNILAETKKKIEINNMINLIILAYKDFFLNLKKYKYNNFKKKAEMMAIK
tara:strand:- start:1024 stop:1608 length:585 start_codon:yes stop_codon:yes gene_type:complete